MNYEILTENFNYSGNFFGFILFILFAIGTTIFFVESLMEEKFSLFIIGIISFALCITVGFLSFNTKPTILNKLKTVEYVVEIKNDEAWKELSLDFNFKEKLYEGKEIYLIEGDGSKLLTNKEN